MRKFAALGLILLLAGCRVLFPTEAVPSTPVQPEATATEPIPTLEAPSTAPASAADGSESISEPGPFVLTVWTAEALAPSGDTPGGQVLLDQLAAFDELYPDVQVDIYTKLTSGAGSTLAYLHSAPGVAPDILPDLALMDREALIQAVRKES